MDSPAHAGMNRIFHRKLRPNHISALHQVLHFTVGRGQLIRCEQALPFRTGSFATARLKTNARGGRKRDERANQTPEPRRKARHRFGKSPVTTRRTAGTARADRPTRDATKGRKNRQRCTATGTRRRQTRRIAKRGRTPRPGPNRAVGSHGRPWRRRRSDRGTPSCAASFRTGRGANARRRPTGWRLMARRSHRSARKPQQGGTRSFVPQRSARPPRCNTRPPQDVVGFGIRIPPASRAATKVPRTA